MKHSDLRSSLTDYSYCPFAALRGLICSSLIIYIFLSCFYLFFLLLSIYCPFLVVLLIIILSVLNCLDVMSSSNRPLLFYWFLIFAFTFLNNPIFYLILCLFENVFIVFLLPLSLFCDFACFITFIPFTCYNTLWFFCVFTFLVLPSCFNLPQTSLWLAWLLSAYSVYSAFALFLNVLYK